MVRDIANDRPFKRFRQTKWLLGLWDRTIDGRYEAMHKFVWYSNNPNSIPKVNGVRSSGGRHGGLLPRSADDSGGARGDALQDVRRGRVRDATFPPLNKYFDPTGRRRTRSRASATTR
jgi:hypothetical protein